MAVTIEDIRQFAAYATARISNGGADLTRQELFEMWMLENPPAGELEEVNAIIRQGLDDIDAGRSQPVEGVMARLDAKYNLSD